MRRRGGSRPAAQGDGRSTQTHLEVAEDHVPAGKSPTQRLAIQDPLRKGVPELFRTEFTHLSLG